MTKPPLSKLFFSDLDQLFNYDTFVFEFYILMIYKKIVME